MEDEYDKIKQAKFADSYDSHRSDQWKKNLASINESNIDAGFDIPGEGDEEQPVTDRDLFNMNTDRKLFNIDEKNKNKNSMNKASTMGGSSERN